MEHEPQAPGTTAGSEFWEARYRERDRIWSGTPNAALVGAVAGLAPGRALDLGCGEGADSLWLAEQGWLVTGVDISATAVGRAAEQARREGLDAITWVVADLGLWHPPIATFDLVSACFLQSPIDFPRIEVLGRAAEAVVGGGHLLVVSHAEPPPWAEGHHHQPHLPDQELVDLGLPVGAWRVVTSEVAGRVAVGPDGQPAELLDSVLLLRRVTS